MSIWGPGPFDNDDAADWFADLRDDPALETIREALADIAEPGHVGYLEVTDGAEAVAAAEILAELLGAAGAEALLTHDEHTDMARALKAELEHLSPRDVGLLLKQALDALNVILNDGENSELLQLWELQADMMPEWMAAMSSLTQRLLTLSAR